MRVCRLYAEREEITSQLSWAALVAICASTVSAKARQNLDHRIVAAKRVALRQIKEAERSLSAQAGSGIGQDSWRRRVKQTHSLETIGWTGRPTSRWQARAPTAEGLGRIEASGCLPSGLQPLN